ncbi:hypothetical protein ACQKWADRAFT_331439 [Trichoderma austrokoningii]
MEKCWFVLKQSDYPPPEFPESGIGTTTGAICLGHIIPAVKELDGVINRNQDGIELTPAVPVYHTKYLGLDWKRETALKAGLDAGVTAPLGAGTPASTELRIKHIFAETEENHKEFDALDRYIIQVDRQFIGSILDDEVVKEHIQRTKRRLGGQWSVFMITGIMVARGAKGEFGESKTFEAMASTKANVADAASVDVTASVEKRNVVSLFMQKASDFVWAVKFTKIWKGVLDKDWEFRTTLELPNEEGMIVY